MSSTKQTEPADLPERLRSLADCDALAGEPLGKLMRIAADKIELLTAALEAVQSELVLTGHLGTIVDEALS